MMFVKNGCYGAFDIGQSMTVMARQALGGAILSVYMDGYPTEQYGLDAIPLFGRFQFNPFNPNLAWPIFDFQGIDRKLTKGGSHRFCFEGFVSYSQLEAFEKQRNGQDFNVRLKAVLNVLNARGEFEQWDLRDEGWHKPAQEWLGVLKSAGYKNYLFHELTFPADAAANPDSAFRHLLKAREHFDKGLYRDCIGALRRVEECLRERRADKGDIASATELYKKDREAMSLPQRTLFLRNTVYNALHAGPHHGELEEAFDRQTAKTLLIMVSALVELYPEPRN